MGLGWSFIYPCLIHFGIAQLVGTAGLLYLQWMGYGGLTAYYENAVLYTTIANVLVFLICLYFYKKDAYRRRVTAPKKIRYDRKLHPAEILILLGIGAALSQYGNILVSIFGSFLNYEEYSQTTEMMTGGKSLLFLIITTGLIAPLAEEAAFRWLIFLRIRDHLSLWPAAVISGVAFGIYHGNLVQGFYASLLGILFAYYLDVCRSIYASLLLHIGANIWSVIWSDLAEILLSANPSYSTELILMIYAVLLAILILGTNYFHRKKKEREPWQKQ